MPRIRSLKPSIWQDEAFGEVSDIARLLFIGLITQADDHGRLRGDPRLVASLVWPYEARPPSQVNEWLAELDRADLISRYAHAGRLYVFLTSWDKHQRVDNAKDSTLPDPSAADGRGPDNPQQGFAAVRREPPRPAAGVRRGEEGSKERKGEERKSAIDTADSPLSHLLADLIAQNGTKRPLVTKRWADAERLLIERDERDAGEARELLAWSQADEFWRANILSMPKFRDKYDQLRLQAKRNGRGAVEPTRKRGWVKETV